MDLDSWLQQISNTAEGPYLRPFSVNAAWRSARILIVGTNPATPLRTEFESFEDYWQALTRDVHRFLQVYRLARTKGDSRTTQRTNELQSYLAPVNALVTNVYPYPASSSAKIPNKKHFRLLGQEIFCRLMAELRPHSLILHGQPASELLDWYTEGHGHLAELVVKRFPHFSGQRAPSGFTRERWSSELRSAAEDVRLLEGAA